MNIGILLWNTCNARCDHCAVSSGPKAKPQMTDEDIFAVIDSAFADEPNPSIGMSGGEAFLFPDRLLRIVRYATERGALVSVNTNGYWGIKPARAAELVARLKDAQLTKLVLSTDDFHTPYVREQAVINVVRACVDANLEVDIQYVFARGTGRLHHFLARWADDLVNISCREIALHPVGRAAEKIPESDVFGRPGLPVASCPSAIPSVSADGRVIPCCNTAGHLPALELGRVRDGDLADTYRRFHDSALFHVLWKDGPHRLYAAAVEAGMRDPVGGYIDQCHLCHHIFVNPAVAAAVLRRAGEIQAEERFDEMLAQFRAMMPAAAPTPA